MGDNEFFVLVCIVVPVVLLVLFAYLQTKSTEKKNALASAVTL